MSNEGKEVMGIISIVLGVIGFFFAGLIFGGIGMALGGVSYDNPAGKVGFWIGFFDVIVILITFMIFA